MVKILLQPRPPSFYGTSLSIIEVAVFSIKAGGYKVSQFFGAILQVTMFGHIGCYLPRWSRPVIWDSTTGCLRPARLP
jgi:hypothetical protein